MKKLFILVAACTLSTGLFAQEKKTTEKNSSSRHMDKMHGQMHDCVMMEDGKMMVMKGDKTMAMDKNMTLKNGTMVMIDGTVKMKDGSTKMLKNGECVYMDGKMGKMHMDKMKSKTE